MLTLREPIKLMSAKNIIYDNTSFLERIGNNYSIIGNKLSPEDLLHITSNPEESPINSENTTNFITDNFALSSDVKLDVINNIVNRILLANTNDFSYQDTIYVTNILNSLGIKDISSFIKNVCSANEKITDVYNLTKIFEENNVLFSKISRVNTQNVKNSDTINVEQNDTAHNNILYLQNEIFKRLQTAQIYSHCFFSHNNSFEKLDNINNFELKVAEQLLESRQLFMAHYKSDLFDAQTLGDSTNTNIYEVGTQKEHLSNENDVLCAGAQAVLAGLIEKVFLMKLEKTEIKHLKWVNVKSAIFETAENTINRFKYFHTFKASRTDLLNFYDEQSNQLLKTEIDTVNKFAKQFNASSKTSFIHMQGGLNEDKSTSSENLYLSKREQRLYSEFLNHYSQINNKQAELTYLRQNEFINDDLIKLDSFKKIFSLTDLSTNFDYNTSNTTNNYNTNDLTQAQTLNIASELNELTHNKIENTDIYESSEIKKQLDAIDLRNKEMAKKINSTSITAREAASTKGITPAEKHKNSLMALTQPEEFFKMLEQTQSEQATKPEKPDNMNLLLAQADESTREIYEEIINAQKNSGDYSSSNVVQPSNIAELVDELSSIAQQNTQHEKTFDETKTDLLHTQQQFEYDRITSFNERQNTIATNVWQINETFKPIDKNHKKDKQINTDEIIEEITQRTQLNRTEVINEQKTINETIDISKTSNYFDNTNANKEDIAALIERTLSKQLGTISERVYTQMEQKLKMERARRGRY